MILFYDTETTGFYRDRLPFDHPDQPHLVQIAAIMFDDSRNAVQQFSFIVDPDCEVPQAASDVHRINTQKAKELGIKEATALGLFRFMVSRSNLVVAHNSKFDNAVMMCASARHRMDLGFYRSFCTMEASAEAVNIPPTEKMIAAGINKPKAPRLEECFSHFWQESLDGAHDALVDVQACARVYYHLIDQGIAQSCEVAP